MAFLRFLAVGLIAGWILGKATRGEGYGVIGNILIGGIGSIIGWFLFGFVGLAPTNIVGSIVAALVGAVVFFFFVSFLRPTKRKSAKREED